MKKIFTIVAFAVVLITYSSCTSCSKKRGEQIIGPSAEMRFRQSLSKTDTLEMLTLADRCMQLLNKRDIDAAIDMLHEYDAKEGKAVSLSSETEKRLRHQFAMFPVFKYERDYYSFMLEGLNDVRFKVWFAEEKNPEVNGEPVTKFMFNPIRIDGEWYLCVKDRGQDSDENYR